MRAAELDLVFVPDVSAESPDYWQTRWRAKLSTASGVDVGEGPAGILAATQRARLPIFFIGHSVGAVAVAQAATRLGGADVRGAFLVAPPDEETLRELEGGRWGTMPRARLPWPSVMVASRTDPWASFRRSRALAEAWGSEFVDAGEAGRIDADSGHGPWPDGLLRLARFLKGL